MSRHYALLFAIMASACAPSGRPLPASCARPERAGTPTTLGPHWTRNVILIALDGVRWKEIFLGVDPRLGPLAGLPKQSAPELLPNIYRRLVDGGVALGAPEHGATFCATGPEFISLPAYQEMLGGRPARNCTSNRCRPMSFPTLLDQMRERVEHAEQVAAIASWERMERATAMNNREVTISVGRHHGASRDRVRVSACATELLDQAARSSSSPGHDDYRPDRYTAALALEYLAVRQPRLLFVGLGDTDEHGHKRDYAAHVEALRAADRFVGAVFDTLEGLGQYGAETSVFLTADHGWSKDFECHRGSAPESGRVWLLAGGGRIQARGIVSAARAYSLADIAPTVRALLDLPPDHAEDAGQPIVEILQ